MDVAWILLVVAGLMEPCWVYTMERSERFRRPGFALATVVLIVVDLALLFVLMVAVGVIGLQATGRGHGGARDR